MNVTSDLIQFILNNQSSLNETLNKVYGHHLGTGFTIFVIVYLIFLSTTGISCNSFLIYTITSNRSLRSVANAFIVNLAICDFITAVINVPQDTAFLWRGYYQGNHITCGFKQIVFFFSLPSSIANLLLLTIERCIKIVSPFRYEQIVTKQRVFILIALVWVYTLAVALFPIIYNQNAIHVAAGGCRMDFTWSYGYFTIIGNFLFPLILILILNIVLFMVAKKHATAIEMQGSGSIRSKGNRLAWFSMVANMKAAKTILLLVAVFLVCWVTFISLAIDNLLCNKCHPRELTWIGNCINYSSITLNPIVYGLFNRKIRKEILRLCCTMKNKDDICLKSLNLRDEFELR